MEAKTHINSSFPNTHKYQVGPPARPTISCRTPSQEPPLTYWPNRQMTADWQWGGMREASLSSSRRLITWFRGNKTIARHRTVLPGISYSNNSRTPKTPTSKLTNMTDLFSKGAAMSRNHPTVKTVRPTTSEFNSNFSCGSDNLKQVAHQTIFKSKISSQRSNLTT